MNPSEHTVPIGLPIYEFEGFRLDAQHRVLYRATGEAIPLPPKAFDTLLHLVQHAGVKRHPVLRSKATPSLAHLRIVLFCGQSASYDPVAAFSDT